jgi:hypothetical protein
MIWNGRIRNSPNLRPKEEVGRNVDGVIVGDSSYGNGGVDGDMDTTSSGQEVDELVTEVVSWNGDCAIVGDSSFGNRHVDGGMEIAGS